jgi:rare lipoprotein A
MRRIIIAIVAALAGAVLLAGCGTKRPPPVSIEPRIQEGVASYIGHRYHGRRTASGEIYDENELSAAHPFYPFGTRVRVVNLENGQTVVLEVNDRGPFVDGRIIDVSYIAARKLGFVRKGLAEVRVEVVTR